MDSVAYILLNILAVALIIYGRRNSKKEPLLYGILILTFSIGIPLLAFFTGVVIGFNSI